MVEIQHLEWGDGKLANQILAWKCPLLWVMVQGTVGEWFIDWFVEWFRQLFENWFRDWIREWFGDSFQKLFRDWFMEWFGEWFRQFPLFWTRVFAGSQPDIVRLQINPTHIQALAA